MTATFKKSVKSKEIPVISIQCDWDDLIFSSNQEIWVSSKIKGKEGIYSKFTCSASALPQCLTNDFSVLNLSKTFFNIKCNSTGTSCIFVAPTKVFPKIHEKKILSMNVTDKLGISACIDDKLLVWNVVTGKIVTFLKGHRGSIYRCRFFPSQLVILSAGADMVLKIWSAETGECPVTLVGHKGPINDFCIVDRGRNIISVSKDGTAKLWDCGKSTCLSTIFQTNEVLNCCTLGELPVDVNLIRDEEVNDREIGTEKKLLLIGSEEGFIYGLGVFSRKLIFSTNVGTAVNVLLNHQDTIITGCQNGAIKIFNISCTEAPLKVFDESASSVLCGILYKKMGVFVGRNDGSVTYYDCFSFLNKRISLTGPDLDPVTDMSLTDSDKIYTSCRDGKIREYSINDAISAFYLSSESK